MKDDLNLIYFHDKFPDELSCRKYLELKLWKNGNPVCPYCSHEEKVYRYANGKTFKCSACVRQFKVTTNTIYESSNLPLKKWFLAFYLISTNKKGISSVQLSKALGITQKSAWYLMHKIRFMVSGDCNEQLSGTVECDETYVGGRRKGSKRGRGATHKTPVFGMLQRRGKLIVMPVENTKRVTLDPIIRKYVEKGTRVMTDEWHAYKKLAPDYKHETVNHGAKEYVRGEVHVNSLEGAWSLLKRSFRGIYHRPSKKYLAKYCAEFQFKYNTRKDSEKERFEKVLYKSRTRIRNSEICR